jgi:hypothetical protein
MLPLDHGFLLQHFAPGWIGIATMQPTLRIQDNDGRGDDMALTLMENFRAVFYTPFYAAFALNAYEAEGLEVQRMMSTYPAETAQALRSGREDVAWGGPIRLLLAHNQQPNSDLVMFCEVVQRDPFFLVGREPSPDWQLADLMHVPVATVSAVPTPWLCLQHDLRLVERFVSSSQVKPLTDGKVAASRITSQTA